MKSLITSIRNKLPAKPFILDNINFTKPTITIIHVTEEFERRFATRLQFPIRQYLLKKGLMSNAENYCIINNWDGDNSLANYLIETGQLVEVKQGAIFISNVYTPIEHASSTYGKVVALANEVIEKALSQQNNVFIFTISPLDAEVEFYRKKYPSASFREGSFAEMMSYYDGKLLSD